MKTLSIAFILSFVAFTVSLGLHFHSRFKERSHLISCVSQSKLLHGTMQIDAKYNFALSDGKGTLRINGMAFKDNQNFPLSRQIQFTYSSIGDTYILENNQIELFSTDRGNGSGVEEHYPSFFSKAGRRLTMVIQRNKNNDGYFMSFGNVPVFYCIDE